MDLSNGLLFIQSDETVFNKYGVKLWIHGAFQLRNIVQKTCVLFNLSNKVGRYVFRLKVCD